MRFPFQRQQGLVVVQVEIQGPAKSMVSRFALDTGAAITVVSAAILVATGYDPAPALARVQVTTGSGVVYVPQIALSKVTTLGEERLGLAVLCHTLPASAGIDGLLGLDFFRDRVLMIDFRAGQIELS
jgi:predicted aspartyl protease